MNSNLGDVKATYIDRPVCTISDFMENSTSLNLSEKHEFISSRIYVEIKQAFPAKMVISELVTLIKSTSINNDEGKIVTVVNCKPNLVLCYKNNVSFWYDSNFTGKRIKRKDAIDYLKSSGICPV